MDGHNEIHHNILNDISRLRQLKIKLNKKYTSGKGKHDYRAEFQRMFDYEYK